MKRIAPWLVAAALLGIWWLISRAGIFHPATLPSPAAVAAGFVEIAKGRLFDDVVASLFRVVTGFLVAVTLAVPLGLALGARARAHAALLPLINFFRSLSPIAWIPFAIIWFGVGDPPAIFIIVMATFFPMVLAVSAAVASIPSVYFRVARDHGITGTALLWQVMFPAILPQLITALRVTAGIAWMVVVAAEMIAVRNGLGALIMDARNGLRMDLVVCAMIVIGTIGVLLDRLLFQLTKMKNVRWGYDR